MSAAASAAARPELTFVVETINLRDEGDFAPLDASLAQLSNQTLASQLFEIVVVVDPGRQPGLPAHLRLNHSNVRVVEAPGAYYYEQKNVGARAARAHVIGFVDADCDPVPTWGETVLKLFAAHGERLGAVQGTYDTPGSDRSALALQFLLTTFGHQAGRTERIIDSLAASNCAFRRADLLSRPFDEKHFFHGADVKMATALRRGGRYVLLAPGAANRHDHEPGIRGMLGRGRYWGYCFMRLRYEEGEDIRYARLFRALGPFGPIAIIPLKALRDLWQLATKAPELQVRPRTLVQCAALMALNAAAVGAGAGRYRFGLGPPPAPQVTYFGAAHETARDLVATSAE